MTKHAPNSALRSAAVTFSVAMLAATALCGCSQSGHANMTSTDAKAFETRPDPNNPPPEIRAAIAAKMQGVHAPAANAPVNANAPTVAGK